MRMDNGTFTGAEKFRCRDQVGIISCVVICVEFYLHSLFDKCWHGLILMEHPIF